MRWVSRLLSLNCLLWVTIGCGHTPMKTQSISPNQEISEMKDRVEQIKKSTVRVLVNGQARGTGFVVTKDGSIASCFHVVQHLQQLQQVRLRSHMLLTLRLNLAMGASYRRPCINHVRIKASLTRSREITLSCKLGRQRIWLLYRLEPLLMFLKVPQSILAAFPSA